MWWICVCTCVCVSLVWAIRNVCSAVSVCSHFLFFSFWRQASTFLLFANIETLCRSAVHRYVLCGGLMAWWNNYVQDAKNRILQRHCCCFTNVLLIWIVSGSPGPVRSLSACISVDWSRHKLITITHWSNWPGPDQRVATDRLVRGSILWSEEVGAESRDAEEGGGMFCNVADQSGWTAQFLGIVKSTYHIHCAVHFNFATKLFSQVPRSSACHISGFRSGLWSLQILTHFDKRRTPIPGERLTTSTSYLSTKSWTQTHRHKLYRFGQFKNKIYPRVNLETRRSTDIENI